MRLRLQFWAILAASAFVSFGGQPSNAQSRQPVAEQGAEQAQAQSGAQTAEEPAYSGPVVYQPKVVARYPHDPAAFTQGLLWHSGALYESTGRVGQSDVRKVDLTTGEVLARTPIPADQFGEGIAMWGDEFVSLTWQDGVIHRWAVEDLSSVASSDNFPFEGWGITTTEGALIFSDGSANLRVIDADTYYVKRTIPVTLNGRPLARLNELEMIDGLVFANVWRTPYIVAIDPADGVVRKLIDFRSVINEVQASEFGAVLNGIAWNADQRRLFVTGKLWPTLFEVELIKTDARIR